MTFDPVAAGSRDPNTGWTQDGASGLVAPAGVQRHGHGYNDLDSDVQSRFGVVTNVAWTDYTPTLGNITVGNGTLAAAYVRLGRTIHYRVKFKLGSTSTVGTAPTVTLPVTPHSIYDSFETFQFGIGGILDAGTAAYTLIPVYGSGTLTLYVLSSDGTNASNRQITATVPMAWGTNDVLTLMGTYEAAS